MGEEKDAGFLACGAEGASFLIRQRRREPLLIVFHEDLRSGETAGGGALDGLGDSTRSGGMRAEENPERKL